MHTFKLLRQCNMAANEARGELTTIRPNECKCFALYQSASVSSYAALHTILGSTLQQGRCSGTWICSSG